MSVIDELSIAEPKTRALREMLASLGMERNVLLIIPEKNEALELASRNLQRVSVARVSELNVHSVLSHEKLLIAKDAVEKMKEAYSG